MYALQKRPQTILEIGQDRQYCQNWSFSGCFLFHMKFSVMIVAIFGRQAAAFSTRLTRVVSRPMATAVDSEATQEAESTTKMPDMDEIVSLCKRRGIIFPSSEIYNGFAGFYDYGPLGAELKKNIKDAWWKNFVTQREDVVGVDSSIIHNPTTWKSSGMSTKVVSCCALYRTQNPNIVSFCSFQ